MATCFVERTEDEWYAKPENAFISVISAHGEIRDVVISQSVLATRAKRYKLIISAKKFLIGVHNIFE